MTFAPLFGAWLIAVVSPGPDFLAVLRTSASQGRRRGAFVALGVVTGIACWACLALTGLSVLLARYSSLYTAMRLIGAIFLVGYGLYILFHTLRSRAEEATGETATAPVVGSRNSWRAYRLGAMTNLANPKAVLFFGALFASIMPAHTGVTTKSGVVVAMLVMAISWFTAVAFLAGSASMMTLYRRIQKRIDAVMGGAFVVLGGALIPR